MKKFFTLAITMAFLSALMPMKVWAWRCAKATVISEPTNGGFVYVSTTNSAPSSYTLTNDVSTDNNTTISDYTFYFYRFCQANSNRGYVFKGWSESSTANSGDYGSKIALTATSANKVNSKPKTGTYYAIFARLAASQNSLSFSVNRPNTAEQTITIYHSHAGTVTVSLSGDDKNQFTLSGSTNFSSTSESEATITVKYAPTCNGNHSATLTISSDNGLNSVTIQLSGTAALNAQTLQWNDEPINVNMQKDEVRKISATASSGLAVTYSSDNTSVLTVDANGNLTAIAEGTATITASQAGDCTYEAAKSITKTITVNDKKTPSFWLENNPNSTQKDLMVDGTTSVNIANIDANSLNVDYDPNLLGYAYDATTGIATITAKNAGTATLKFTQTETGNVFGATRTFTFNISKYQGTLSVNSNLGSTYKVDDVIGNCSDFYTASNSEVSVNCVSSNSNVIVVENNQLKAVGAGTATITFSQEETYKWLQTSVTKTITVKKYTLTPSLTQASAVWGETISNPFTVTDDRGNAFTSYTVTAQNPNIADYENGQIVTYSNNGTANFDLSFGKTYKYNDLNQTLSLSVAAAPESECYVVSQLDKITINNNTFNFNGGIGDILTCHLSGGAGVGTITITGNKADGSSTSLLTSKSKDFRDGVDITKTLNSDIISVNFSYSGSLDAYASNIKVTRLKYLNASASAVEAIGAPSANPSGSFDVNYGDCGSTFTIRSSNPQITVSPTSFYGSGNSSQTVTFTGNTQATGKAMATITVYNSSRSVPVNVTCYQQYNVNFITGEGASTVDPLIVTYEHAYNLPANPTKTGYTFVKWQKDGVDFVKEETYTLKDNITLTAIWEAKSYNVSLNYNDNVTDNKNVTVKYDETYNLGTPTRKGYTFQGWYDANNVVFATSGTYKTDNNITLTAHWKANTYTISFETNGGDDLADNTATYDASYNLPTPTRTGYTFVKWQKDGVDFVKEETYTFTDNINLTAIWTPNTYDLILDYNYTNAPANVTRSEFFTYDAIYSIGITEEPADKIHPVGYHFAGWYADAACTQAYTLNGTYKTDGATTLYAKWAPNTYGLTLYYNYDDAPNNGVLATNATYFTYDLAYNISEVPDENDHPVGYHFDGWYSDAACTDGNMWDKGIYTNPADLALYAKWSVNTYTLTFVLNGGNWVKTDQSNQTTITYGQPYGELLNSNAVQRSGYSFEGWYSDETLTAKKVETTDKVSANPILTLYAKWKINDLTVTFNANYPNNRQGASYDNVTKDVVIGNTYILPANNPSIAGYTFVGWKTEDNIPVDASTVCQIGVDHTLNGCWEANTYKVTYNPNPGNWNGSTQSVEAALTYDQTYGQDNKFPDAPTRDGYTFQGWFTAADGGSQVTADMLFETAGDQTLYAHWSNNGYKLIFDYKDEAGTTVSVAVIYDQNYPAIDQYPTQPTRTGFTFAGWFDAFNNPVNLSELPSRTYQTVGNQRLFAHWNPLHYTVKFKTDANSEAIDSMSISVAYHDVYGILPKLKENGQEIPTNWYDAPSNGMLVTPTTIFQPENINQEFILYATTNPQKFALQLIDGNQTTTIGISEGQTYADALTKAGIDKSETGKTFLGWSATENGTVKDLSVGFSEKCQTLYAIWEKAQLQVSFADAEHTDAVYGVMKLAYGDNYGTGTRSNATQAGLPEVAKVAGKTFKGWAYADNLFVNNTTPATFTTADHTLTAVWAANKYTIYLHDAQANKTSAIDVTYGADYTLANPAAISGYTFDGWYEENQSAAFADKGTYTQSADLHLYAKWTAITGITISFNANGGSEASSISATFNQAYGNLPTTTREGYTFVGWFTAAEGGTEVTNTTICKQTEDHHLFAQWKANNYTIYLHDAQANKTATIDVLYDGTYTLTNPTAVNGYTFDGWFTAAEGGKKYESTTYSYILNEDLHLYAHWTAVNYMVTFSVPENATLETTSKEVTFDSQYGELPTPELEGYVFSGWFNANGNIVTSTDICRTPSNHTLTARWTANSYTITFDANGGECHTANKQVAYNTAIGKLPLATRPGYTFNGWWANAAERATSETDIFTGLSEMTLTADWKACEYTVTFLAEGGKIILSEGNASESNQKVTYAGTYGGMPTATRDGYSFDGWFTCDNEKVTSSTLYTIIGDQELHAHWTAEKYKVTFSVPKNAILETTSKEVTFDSPYGELPTPTLAGYVFTGWYTAELGGSLVSHSTTVSTAQAHTLYARWTEADITLHFNSNGGSTVADQTRKFSGLYCEPALPTPTKEGYTLIGWYLENGTLITSTTNVDLTTEHTLTAYWAQAGVPYLVLGDNWKISSPEADNDYRFKPTDNGHYSLSNIRIDAEGSMQYGETTLYQASVTIFINGTFYGVEATTVMQTTENGNSGLFTPSGTKRATIQSAEMLTRWFNFDLYEESSGTWRLSISCGKQGNPTEVDNNESEQQARAKKYIDDGKVFIQTQEDRIYNASGQLVK